MDKVIIFFDGNWADEMDIKGFQLGSKSEWEKFVKSIPDKPFSIYIGSNQDMEFSGKAAWLSNITIKEITDEEYTVLKKFFPYEYGKFPEPEPNSFDD